jgi:hypothetical protein
MSYHDIQQVCLNGHQITDSYNSAPELRRAFCNQCGAETIIACPECSASIKGDYRVPGVVAIGFTTPVPKHCENCGKPYPWAKGRFAFRLPAWSWISSFLIWHRRLSMLEKIGLWGSIASIVSLGLYFLPPLTSSQSEAKAQASTTGAQSPAIGANQGSVTINYGAPATPHEKAYVLRNGKSGATLVVSRPSLDAATEPKSHVCMAPAGTPITLTGETAKMGGIDMWRKVKITSGECANKVGWAAIENISIE